MDSDREQPVFAVTPGELIPQWRSLVPDGRGGDFVYLAGKTAAPKSEFWALRIDLAAPGLRIVARGGRGEEQALSTRVSSFVRDNGLLAGINATPFDPASAREGEPRTNVGIVVSDGVMLSPPNPRFDALVWYADGVPAIVPQRELGGAGKIVNAVGGFHRILKNSELTERALERRPRYARSAAGISADARFLYLLVIDGGRIGSAGATEEETALLLRALGASDGLNLDGGGSSALAIRYPDGKVRVVNTPIHDGIPGRERAVAACLGIGLEEVK